MSESEKVAVSRVLALIAVIRRDLPGLLPEGLAEGAARAIPGAGDVLTALLKLLPPELQTAIEQEAAAMTAAALRARLEDEIRAGSKTAAKMLLGLVAAEGGRQ
jgi:hypothetical protein